MEENSKEKHTLVVGGTRGSGRFLVKAMVRENHVVSVIGRRPPSEPDQQLPNVHHWTVDLSDEGRISEVWGDIIDRNGKLNNLVFFQRFRGEGDLWAGEIETTLTATKNAIERLSCEFDTTGEPAIVIVSTLASDLIADDQPLSYHVAKAGLNQMVRYYAVALGPKGIRVNAVSPGIVLKEEAQEFYRENPQLQERYSRLTPLGRMGTPEDIAQAIVFLCGPRASFITGQNLVVDGGVSLQLQQTLALKLAAMDEATPSRDNRAGSED